MNDKNNIEIMTGDICEITDAYFKNDNGLWLVTSCAGDPTTTQSDITLHKVGKTGKLMQSGSTVTFWPLKSYCSDYRKNAAAREHNRENAQICVVNSVPTWYAAQHFQKEAQDAQERADEYKRRGWDEEEKKSREISAFYTEVAERLGKTAEQPKEKAPEKGVKFYYNGIKVDGGKLIKCGYSLSSDSVSIYVRDYSGRLPSEYFTVKNDSDLYTDYHDDDHTTLTPKHPLYKYARYAALKCIMNPRSYYKPTDEQRAEWERAKDPGQPTQADFSAVEEMKTAQESARIAQEHAAELAERERILNERNAGRVYIEQIAAKYPIKGGAPIVTICWSEHPAFYAWNDNELKLSVSASEIVLKYFDVQQNSTREMPDGHGWYYKTKFIVEWKDPKTGEANSYTGRYDLGDNDGGLIAHIRQTNAEVADYLETFTDGGRVVSVDVPAWFKGAVRQYKQQKEQRERAERDEAEQAAREILEAVELLTDEQIEAAIRAIDPNDKSKLDVARFFLQELMRRDQPRAIEVYREWRESAV